MSYSNNFETLIKNSEEFIITEFRNKIIPKLNVYINFIYNHLIIINYILELKRY